MASGGYTGGYDRSVDSRVTCSICLEPYRGRQPKLLPCSHTFCLPCLTQIADKERQRLIQISGEEDEERDVSITCPTCRTPISLPPAGVSGLHANVYVDDAGDPPDPRPILCDLCEEGHKAQLKCATCKTYFDTRCRRIHDKFCKTGQVSEVTMKRPQASEARVEGEEGDENVGSGSGSELEMIETLLKKLKEKEKKDEQKMKKSGSRQVLKSVSSSEASLTEDLEPGDKSVNPTVSLLMKKMTALENQMTVQQNQITLLTSLNDKHDKEITSLKSASKKDRDAMTMLEREVASLRDKNAISCQDKEQLRSEVTKLKDDVTRVREYCTTLQVELDKLQGGQGAVQSDIAMIQTEQNTMKTEQAKLQTEQNTMKTEQAKLQTEQNTMKIEQAKLQTEQNTMKTEQAKLQTEQNTMKTEQAKLQTEQNTMKTEQAKVQTEQNTMKTEQAKLQTEQNTMKTEQAKLQTEQNTMKTEQAKLQTEQNSMKTEQAKLQTEQNSMKTEQAKLQTETNSVKTEQAKLQTEQNSMKTEQGKLQTDLNKMQTDFADLKTEQDKSKGGDMKQEVEKVKKEVDYLKEKNSRMEKDSWAAIAALTNKLGAFSRQVAFQAVRENSSVILMKGATLICGNVISSVGGGYDPKTGVFTVPVAGVYCFMFTSRCGLDDMDKSCALDIMLDYKDIAYMISYGKGYSTAHAVIHASARQKLFLRCYKDDSPFCGGWASTFTGFLVCPDV